MRTTRREALAFGETHYYTGKPCKHGHIAKRYAASGDCSACSLVIHHRPENMERCRESAKAWRVENPERHRLSQKRWKEENTTLVRSYRKSWVERNPGKALECSRAGAKKYRIANPGKRAAYQALREARKIKATPKWADHNSIRAFYEACPKGYHVDHIIPLNNPVVCGLHVLENLQYLPAADNIKKSNVFKERWHE
jgi:hypothetical protein